MRVLMALALIVAAQQAPRDAPPLNAPPAVAGTGVIKGRVVAADTGTPIRRAVVTIAAPGAPARTIYTDGAGRYEARNLAPGAYTVDAQPSFSQAQFLPAARMPPLPDGSPRKVLLAAGQTIEWPDIGLPRAGAIVGRIVDEHGDPVSAVSVVVQRPGERTGPSSYASQPSDEFGRYRIFRLVPGEYQILARPGSVGVDGPLSRLAFVDTYYPSTLSREDGGRVQVRAGQETIAGDLQLISGRLLRVRGTVVSASPVGVMVSLDTDNQGHSMSVGADGRFSFRPQPPGQYRLTARRLSDNREATLEYVTMPLTLTDADLDDVVITMKPTITFSGRVVFEGAAAPPLTSRALTIRIERRDRSSVPQLFLSPIPVAQDLTFTARNLAGELLLRPSGGLPGAWSLKAVLLGNDDITDVPREFRAEDNDRVQIVLTNRWSELSGTVTDGNGKVVTNGTVVLFGEDRSAWFAESSRLHATRPARDGTFVLRGLRAGRYHLIALPASVRWDFQQIDKAALEKYAAEATPVTVGEDDRRQVDVKVAALGGDPH